MERRGVLQFVHWESLLPFLVFFFILHCWELNNFNACYLEPCWLLCFIFLHWDPLFCWWELFMVMFVWHTCAPCSPNQNHTIIYFLQRLCVKRGSTTMRKCPWNKQLKWMSENINTVKTYQGIRLTYKKILISFQVTTTFCYILLWSCCIYIVFALLISYLFHS